MINLETPKKFGQLVDQAHMVATEIFRKNSRKYDLAEHEYPKELDMLAAVIEGANPSGAGAGGVGGGSAGNGSGPAESGNRNGSNMATLLGLIELCWGDVGLLLTMPRQGLGQAAIAAVANPEQLARRPPHDDEVDFVRGHLGNDFLAVADTKLDGDFGVRRGERGQE